MEVCYSVYAHTITVGDSRYSYGGIVMVATYRFDDGRYALRARSASRAYLLSSNLFGTCPRPSEQNALIRKPLYKRYFLMRKLSKIVQHTLENSK